MKTSIIFNSREIKLSAKCINEGVQFPNDDNSNMLHNQFRVRVYNAYTGKATYFNFYGSNYDYEMGKRELYGKELLSAFHCFLDDCICAKNDFNEFCADLGYDNDSIKALRIYRECQRSLKKYDRIFSSVDIYDLANYLQEKYEI